MSAERSSDKQVDKTDDNSEGTTVSATKEGSFDPSASATHANAMDAVDLRADNRAVNWSRAMVILVLLAAATALGYFTYVYVHQEEVDNFETEVCCS